jgi:hypothetical protein
MALLFGWGVCDTRERGGLGVREKAWREGGRVWGDGVGDGEGVRGVREGGREGGTKGEVMQGRNMAP